MFLFIYEERSKQEQSFSTYSLSNSEKQLIKDGDIILRHGYGLVSDLIVSSLNEGLNISHCAIVHKTDSVFQVIHSVSQNLSDVDGVQAQDIQPFIRDSKENSVIVLRYKDSLNTQSRIAKRALYYLKKKIAFDHNFDIADSSTFYCTELIWKAIKDEYQTDIFKNYYNKSRFEHMKFNLFMDTAYFQVIFNHNNKK